MAKRTRRAVLLLATIMLLLPVSSVLAADSTTGFRTWPAKTTTETKKVWTITFDSALARASVNANNIYVTTSNKTRITSTPGLSADNLTVTVTPYQAYTAGDYYLYITNGITSMTGKKMAEPIMFPFTVAADTSTSPSSPTSTTYILDVDINFSSFVPEINVQTAPDVYKVNVNKTQMQYMGDNTYSAGIYGLEEGSTVLFEAYGQNGRLLQSYNYQES